METDKKRIGGGLTMPAKKRSQRTRGPNGIAEVQFIVRLRQKELDAITAAAKALGIARLEWVRRALRAALVSMASATLPKA